MAEDGGPAVCSRLCRLVGSALRSHAEALDAIGRSDEPTTPLVLAMEMKDVIISLTLVYREVKMWTSGDSDWEKGVTLEPIICGDCSWHMGPPIECQSCLASVVSLLALMIRLSFWTHWHGYALVSWAQLLRKYFKDIILKPITRVFDDLSKSVRMAHPVTSHNHIRRAASLMGYLSFLHGFRCMSPWRRIQTTIYSNPNFKRGKHGSKDSEETRRDVSHISNIFNPIRLLHLFLLLIHYDHSVLLDYLISKDAGIPCVQYLLRCLRLVCESWGAFSEFSMCHSEIVQVHPKRRKPSMETRDSSEPAASPTDDINGSGALESSRGTAKRPYQDARGCLLSLKTSVEGLHQRGLFPYNPTALLRRYVESRSG
ncbi:unnamed protein product [Spirodela intermedia]|uniref:Uncharacterized protein n=1 Tax=Spirodela intermedia TaxID=51605 RepID=A0A7I8ILE5_SPIIN|nr:unnamed protein product [Spirodela intermedia]CAA6657761.1 unnamed protein product [Spirodela intermedia]